MLLRVIFHIMQIIVSFFIYNFRKQRMKLNVASERSCIHYYYLWKCLVQYLTHKFKFNDLEYYRKCWDALSYLNFFLCIVFPLSTGDSDFSLILFSLQFHLLTRKSMQFFMFHIDMHIFLLTDSVGNIFFFC